MPLVIQTLHRAKDPALLNEEWIVVENTGPAVWHAAGCTVTIARNASDRPRQLGTLDPGFYLQPGEKIRLVTGTPSKKAQGAPPDDKDIKNYHLFLKEPVLPRPGTVVRIALKQLELARATWAPDAKDGLAKS